jgi:hypothetical protein
MTDYERRAMLGTTNGSGGCTASYDSISRGGPSAAFPSGNDSPCWSRRG